MDRTEKQVIDELFDKLEQAERQGGPRDREAEALIQRHLSRQPGAPYYMAQAIVFQEEALKQAQQRIQELESELAQRPAGDGFLAGLFGGGTAGPRTPSGAASENRLSAYQGRQGFLGGAMQTAMGVAGGMMLGSFLGSLLGGGNQAAAAEPSAAPSPADDFAADDGFDSGWGGGFDDGGGFDF